MTRVLVVDDSGAMRGFIRAALESDAGDEVVEVHEASGGFDALRTLSQGDYRLLIVDINMSDINGLELISLVRENERYRETPLLVISSETSERDRDRALARGASAFLGKPFSSEVLVENARRLLGDRTR